MYNLYENETQSQKNRGFMEKSVKKRFQTYLRNRGNTVTHQRNIILDEIMKKKSHFDIDSFVSTINRKGRDVSRATVYRTIQQLEDAGIVRKIDFDKGYANYEIIPGKEHHEHLVCSECGKIIEFSDKSFEKRIRAIAECNEFTMEHHSVEIFGKCSECREKHRKESLKKEKI